jgi:hypothetical protein
MGGEGKAKRGEGRRGGEPDDGGRIGRRRKCSRKKGM